MKRKNNSIKKCSWLIALVLTAMMASKVHAQHMHMEAHTPKNVYVLMMDTMMQRMSVAPIGKTKSAYFINQMVAHHLGAIDMARYEIAHGKNPEMVQLAKSILAEQQSELTEMSLMLKDLSQIDTLDNTFRKTTDAAMENMMRSLPVKVSGWDTDRLFAAVMVPHHRAAVDMARVLLAYKTDQRVSAFARGLISNEQIEIDQMESYLKKQ